jgi:hypothetical protein
VDDDRFNLDYHIRHVSLPPMGASPDGTLNEALPFVPRPAPTRAGLRPASPTPLNCPIGPHRRFDWLRMSLDEVKEIKNALGGTVNDVVLALASGAVRRFLRQRGERVEDLELRAMIPVNMRRKEGAGSYGNRVSMTVARLSARTRPFAMTITNLPGPQFTAYVLGAPARETSSDHPRPGGSSRPG